MIEKEELTLPLLPLRDVVVFPYMVIPLFVGRKESIAALNEASRLEKKIFLVSQKDPAIESPRPDDFYTTGTIGTVVQMLRLEDGTVKVLVEGIERAQAIKINKGKSHYEATIRSVDTEEAVLVDSQTEGHMRTVLDQFEELIKVNRKIPSELLATLAQIEEPARLVDNIAAHLTVKLSLRQDLLETIPVFERLELLQMVLAQEIDILEVEKRVQGRVKKQVERSQRKFYLDERREAIEKELQDIGEGGAEDEVAEFEKAIAKSGMPKNVLEKANSELKKLKNMPAMSAEATVTRNYLDWLLQVPWKKKSRVSHNLEKAQKQLDADHYGLKEVKQRVVEYMAVQGRVKKLKGPILCLVGPPGVGKTSLGQSMAKATGREFIRIALGGVRDEAEIRGHRRTYIGALPGKIIQKMAKSGVRNPLCMLDEIDKISSDFRGDPAAALLEVLDPEQNHLFNDHFLEVDYDLSDVMFVATANSLNIPAPLLDRMELIRIAGYTEEEKMNIAENYLLPKQMEMTGLKKKELQLPDSVIRDMIRYYTREAGVRSLEREIAKLCRKVVHKLDSKPTAKGAKKKTSACKVTSEVLGDYLGVKRHRFGVADEANRIGQVAGLAWTEVGGEMLSIEAQVLPGKGKLQQTGCLGDVMMESIQAAMTVVRFRAHGKIAAGFFQENDIHVHVPEGATPKDGPSAGVGMTTAILSAVTNIPVRSDTAMTGEITLRGEVLPIGGLKEKLLAAVRAGILHVIIPKDNERDLAEIPANVLDKLTIHPVQWIDEVIELALERVPDSWIVKTIPLPGTLKKKPSGQQPKGTH
jgi:ATP-dependent Lon protease